VARLVLADPAGAARRLDIPVRLVEDKTALTFVKSPCGNRSTPRQQVHLLAQRAGAMQSHISVKKLFSLFAPPADGD
jgi:hypothetical protein